MMSAMYADLSAYPLSAIFLVSLFVILVASEIGRLLGSRARERSADNVPALESAVLGLLALMIGFTFAMALSRFEARRDAVVSEANAIGTTALRARLMPAPQSADVLKLLQEYMQIRLDIAQKAASAADLEVAVTRSNDIQETLWQRTKAIAANDTAMVPTGLFIQALNEMIEKQRKRVAAVRARVPNIALIALYAIATLGSGLAGYANGLATRRVRIPVYVMGVLVAAIILMIQDLDRPGAGFIEVSQQPMIEVAASIAAYVRP
jgi:hypothetical protein